MPEDVRGKCKRQQCGGSRPAECVFFALGGLARSQISARIGARRSNNLTRGVFPYPTVKPKGRRHRVKVG